MLFNSYEFIVFFLPITIIVYFLIGSRGYYQLAMSWLVSASLFFYGWWNPAYLILIIGSILFNYTIGITLSGSGKPSVKKILTIAGVAINLTLLGYFKYANFFVDNYIALAGGDYHLEKIILPLAISFFTFQQITYLIDAYRGETKEYNFLHYCLFVLFFPQLIAGPIVHHKEMLPQFARDVLYKVNHKNIAIGITIFVIGLFKKIVIADGMAVYANPVFAAADGGSVITFFEAWVGVLAYSFQLYFDFSGYSDMAIGIARMFGVRLPLNFNSPYKSLSIIDFWRRWHITLSRFLRDYLYIALGGSRRGKARRHINLFITMLLGGMWHGAGWNFILWGFLHGSFLIINHFWRGFVKPAYRVSTLYYMLAWFVTFNAVVFAWVPFRVETLSGAKNIWMGMLGLNGISFPEKIASKLGALKSAAGESTVLSEGFFTVVNYSFVESSLYILALLVAILIMPNTQQIMCKYRPAFKTYGDEILPQTFLKIVWRPNTLWAAIVSLTTVIVFIFSNRVSDFLYFQF